ncbi:MAG: exonuclease domain-containing protein [Planctomycetaceae bacterium]
MTCVAVIDVETTGLNPYRHDRIVEIAALVIHVDGSVVREFATLVNPERDIGPTSIHGLVTRDVVNAPRFRDIAGALLDALAGSVAIAGHNVRFDHSFLAAEFDRLGHSFPDGLKLCTMHLAGGGNLACACSDYGIPFHGDSHAAWNDATATARLLATLLKDAPDLSLKLSCARPIVWPSVQKTSVDLLSRDESRRRQAEPATYLQRLLNRVQPELPSCDEDSAVLAYTNVLDRALEDRHIDEEEGQALVEIAERWGIPSDQIQKIHSEYLISLVTAALLDGVVTKAERRDLTQVSSLLSLDSSDLAEVLDTAAKRLAKDPTHPVTPSPQSQEQFAGQRVCFTGECQCLFEGDVITRQTAAKLAAARSMIVVESVTKQLDLLVVADPLSQSGKAKKAHRYGIRILHEPVFWKALGVEVE